ncbi:hypothetical protein L210DRAFT_3539970 [Boletus edulis BED1]|uniref:Uncharacterized protein n=1 Tax=Boletus edulis BED1 TaxID=1328754 RepID=A0AAD4BTH0_BOLED|nr:hypothetical protein L210DRAFT_3539970 [Boletus edulis BED1]
MVWCYGTPMRWKPRCRVNSHTTLTSMNPGPDGFPKSTLLSSAIPRSLQHRLTEQANVSVAAHLLAWRKRLVLSVEVGNGVTSSARSTSEVGHHHHCREQPMGVHLQHASWRESLIYALRRVFAKRAKRCISHRYYSSTRSGVRVGVLAAAQGNRAGVHEQYCVMTLPDQVVSAEEPIVRVTKFPPRVNVSKSCGGGRIASKFNPSRNEITPFTTLKRYHRVMKLRHP